MSQNATIKPMIDSIVAGKREIAIKKPIKEYPNPICLKYVFIMVNHLPMMVDNELNLILLVLLSMVKYAKLKHLCGLLTISFVVVDTLETNALVFTDL